MVADKGLAELGEFGLIERIQQQAEPAPFLRLGIGDDCSIQAVAADDELLTSTDLLLEGVHFNLQWTDFESLGCKSAAVNISDIAAMGGVPRSLYLGLAVPDALSVEQLDRFVAGFVAVAQAHGAVLAGGDTCRSSGPLVISVTAEGTAPRGQAVCRSGAGAGDLVFVSGTLGDSALALRLLQQGEQPSAPLAGRHHRPQARVSLGRRLAETGLATAMIDVSDGLVADLGHILKASGHGAVLQLQEIPLSPGFSEVLAHRPEWIELALTGGEDYELLFTVAAERADDIAQLAAELDLPLTRIGTLQGITGLQILQRDGRHYHFRRSGFDHFSGR
ncbi:MAG: thiamine-phosphate kinase [Desulfuromonadales bacterium]|nr:thiamine-phosphate kinase [Desulfuromonadales bacterium]